MPPQNNQVPPVPPSPQPTGSGFSVDSLQKNDKFMTTIKTFAIYGAVMYVVNAFVGMILSSMHLSQYGGSFNVFALVSAIIFGVIGAAIGGAIFYFLYDPIHNWVKRTPFLSKYIHDMFTLFWKPYIVFFIIGAIFGLLGMLGLGATLATLSAGYAVTSFGGLFIGWVISLVVQVVVYYWYAKSVSTKLTSYYPW